MSSKSGYEQSSNNYSLFLKSLQGIVTAVCAALMYLDLKAVVPYLEMLVGFLIAFQMIINYSKLGSQGFLKLWNNRINMVTILVLTVLILFDNVNPDKNLYGAELISQILLARFSFQLITPLKKLIQRPTHQSVSTTDTDIRQP